MARAAELVGEVGPSSARCDVHRASAGVVSGFCDEQGRPVPATASGPWSAYVLFADGCMPWPDCTPGGETIGPPLRSGAHHTNNGDSRLRATFTAGHLPDAHSAHASPGKHGEIPAYELGSMVRFFARHLGR